MWVNSHCVMKSPIVEPGSLGKAIKISALSREPGNPGLIVSPMYYKLRFMGDLDDVQFQPIYKILLMTQWYHWVLIIKQIWKTTESI